MQLSMTPPFFSAGELDMRGTSTTVAGCETGDCTKAVWSGSARWHEGGEGFVIS